ncbi:amino acid ABC transporter permease [Acerihabitans sp. KWT182]|uniref:Amino acid ABC transporter permease n=1 Tax=Acerihabitans sp. KWT182 TaxID=3157919 RepID=A0AAU7Q684_9GAMM
MHLLIDYLPLFLHSILVTIELSFWTLLASTLFAVLLAWGITCRFKPLRWLFIVVVEIIRAIPIFVLVLTVYFVLPIIAFSLDPFTSIVISLSLWGAANGAEIIRGGLMSVDQGQKEAGSALGFHPLLFFTLVLIPQIVRVILPPFCGLSTTLIQATTLGSVVGVVELLRTGQIVIERSTSVTGGVSSFAVYGGMLIVYFILCSLVSKAGSLLEQRLSRHIVLRAPRVESFAGQAVPPQWDSTPKG